MGLILSFLLSTFYQEDFQINIIDLNEMYMLCHKFFFFV
jgi:hypothetical protein